MSKYNWVKIAFRVRLNGHGLDIYEHNGRYCLRHDINTRLTKLKSPYFESVEALNDWIDSKTGDLSRSDATALSIMLEIIGVN